MFFIKSNFLIALFILIIVIHTSIGINLAHAVFGQSDTPLEDYFNYGRNYTGVAIVNAKKEKGLALGTANLVDVGIETLKGRVMVTAAHVLEGINMAGSSIRFIDENNNSFYAGIQSIYYSKEYLKEHTDIGFIVLDNSVDTEKFQPLKLNLTRNNESLMGNEISIIGCSPIMGQAGSNFVVEEDYQSSLRRGMQTLLRYGADTSPRMNCGFHQHAGFIKITREPEYNLTTRPLARKSETAKELAELELLLLSNKEKGIEDIELNGRYLDLFWESKCMPREETRKAFSKKLDCDETLKDQLATLTDADDLDKEEVLQQWERFINEKNVPTNCAATEGGINLGKYNITMYKPLPLLSGITYHGDSGGAWILEDEIVAVSEAHTPNTKFHELIKIPVQTLNLKTHFSTLQEIIKTAGDWNKPLLQQESSASFGTSIWSCKDWIQLTLQRIVSDLNLM